MNANRSVVSLCLVLAAMTSLVFGQPGPLKGSSSFEVNIGLWNEAQTGQQISMTGIKQSAKTSGFVGGVGYSYWMREYFAVTVEASMLSGEASSMISLSNIQQRASSVVSVLIGMRYYLPQPEPEDRVRPFVALGIGSYIGSEAENSLFFQSAHSESVIGGRVGVGIDALLGSWFKLNANVAYNLMADFKTPVGARNNFNGYDMSFGFGFVF
ncbi:MAG: outer membrane beta-barrel protein [Ignavibacteriales bacterium]|nr:outer membrane beta-barrel protein [Ignavibacteriales bacterium]